MLFTTLALAVALQAGGAPPTPKPFDCSGPEYRQFDFWVGDWDVFNPAGQKVGVNIIQMFAGGCGVLENWTNAGGGDGKSINYYDASTQKWYQHWIGIDGGALRFA